MPSKRISVVVALEGADEGLKRAVNSAERSFGQLSCTARCAGAQATAGVAEVQAWMSALSEQLARAKAQLPAFLSINRAAGKVQVIVKFADAWNLMGARLKLATAGRQGSRIALRRRSVRHRHTSIPTPPRRVATWNVWPKPWPAA